MKASPSQAQTRKKKNCVLLGTAIAFSLVEVTLALGVASFCMIAIFGLIPVGLRANKAAVEQTAADGILSTVSADLRATPPAVSGTTSYQFAIPIPANPVSSSPAATSLYFSSDSQSTTSLDTNSRYLLTITFLPNGPNAKTATLVRLQVTWPAAAGIANAEGSAQTFIALDRN